MAESDDNPDPDSWSGQEALLKRLDASMLRGVSLSVCLSGQTFFIPSQGMYQVQACDYGLSFQVSKFDYFLSDD